VPKISDRGLVRPVKIPVLQGGEDVKIEETAIASLESEFTARQAEAAKAIQAKYADVIEQAIARARSSGERAAVEAPDGAEACAYPLRGDRVAWGVNGPENGFNVLRGVRLADGRDAGVM
jgi:hypothetical protein